MTNEELAREAAEKAGYELCRRYKQFNSGGLAVALMPYFSEAITSAVEGRDKEIKRLQELLGHGGTPSVRECHICKSPYADFSTASSITCWGCKQRAAVEAARVEEREAILRAVNAIKQRKAASHARAVRARRAAAEACRRSDFETCMEIEQQIRARGKETA